MADVVIEGGDAEAVDVDRLFVHVAEEAVQLSNVASSSTQPWSSDIAHVVSSSVSLASVEQFDQVNCR